MFSFWTAGFHESNGYLGWWSSPAFFGFRSFSLDVYYIDSSPREPRFVLVPLRFASKVWPRAGLGEPRSASNANKPASSWPLKQGRKKCSKYGCDRGTSTVDRWFGDCDPDMLSQICESYVKYNVWQESTICFVTNQGHHCFAEDWPPNHTSAYFSCQRSYTWFANNVFRHIWSRVPELALDLPKCAAQPDENLVSGRILFRWVWSLVDVKN